MRLFHLMLAGLLCLSVAALAQDRVATKLSSDQAVETARERDRLFAEASALADKNQWPEAVRAANNALEVELGRSPQLESEEARTILQYLAVWQQLAGDFAAAAATYERLLESCTRGLGPKHWLTRATAVDLEDCQRDALRRDDDQRQLAEGNRFEMQALRLQGAGKYEAAGESATRALEIRENVVGRDDGCISECLNSIGAAQLALGKFQDAQPILERSAAVRLRLFGPENPSTLATLQSLSVVCMHFRDYERTAELLSQIRAGYEVIYGGAHPSTLHATLELAAFHMHRGDVKEAEPLMNAVLDKQLATLGEKHLAVAQTRMRIGQLYARTGDVKAKENLEQAAAMFRELGAGTSPDLARTLATLGLLEYAAGNYPAAEQACQQSLTIFAKTVGQNDPAAIDALACLARVHKAVGNLGEAERLLAQVLELYVQTYGEQNERTATVLTELGSCYQTLGNHHRAQECLVRAIAINRAVLGPGHPDTITTLLTLASDHALAARLDEAEKLITEAVDLAQANLGPDHDATHAALFMLGNFYFVQQKYDEAEKSIRALWISRKLKYPDQTHANAVVLESLVEVLIKKEDYQQALELGQEVLAANAQTLAPDHSGWTGPLLSTATAYAALGRYAEAKPLAARAIEIYRRGHERASIAQTEQQQIKLSVQQRGAINLYLSLPASAIEPEEAYAQVLQSKGAIHARQVRNRERRGAELAPLVLEVQKVSAQVATLSLQVPEPSARDAWLKQLRELRERKARLEAQLALATRDTPADDELLTPAALRRLLPQGTALVDLFIHSHVTWNNEDGRPKRRREVRLNAFVVRRDQPLERIDLGELKPIEAAVDAWRAKGRYAVDSRKEPSAVTLHEQVWQPLEPHLAGCQTVLFSPDGKLARFPLGALPGSKPGSFLIEDLSIAVISVPQLLGELLNSETKATTGEPDLLVIGDVDYDANVATGAPLASQTSGEADAEVTRGELISFARLKSTGPEAQALAQLYRQKFPRGKVTLLEQATATEAAFRREAPLHRNLLVATHGFYAPVGISSALAAQNRPRDLAGNDGTEEYCETLSGLALAGANRGAAGDSDDGILTAAEVSSLDLRGLDLAILSGCETALGAVSDGEGALGLERAFQVAGARTTVSSLWTVPDGKTSQLMQRFHKNLWDKKMSKLAALREAQLWLLRNGGKEPSPTAKPSPAAAKDTPAPRAAPYYWAAFILSGDWR